MPLTVMKCYLRGEDMTCWARGKDYRGSRVLCLVCSGNTTKLTILHQVKAQSHTNISLEATKKQAKFMSELS